MYLKSFAKLNILFLITDYHLTKPDGKGEDYQLKGNQVIFSIRVCKLFANLNWYRKGEKGARLTPGFDKRDR